MNLSEYILEDRIISNLKSSVNNEVITELLIRLQKLSIISEKIKLESILINSEYIIDKRIVFLHCQSIETNSLITILGLSKKGMNFNCPTNQLSNLVLLTLSPTISPNIHRKFLSRFKLMISNNNIKTKIINATNAKSIANTIFNWDKEEQNISNI
tara:strand:- start:326 stop:793 length:468 start_codon:yes stop_codon:yes gene_type:complete